MTAWTTKEQIYGRQPDLRIYATAEDVWGQSLRDIKVFLFKKQTRKWVARIGIAKKEIHLGCFKNEIDAAIAYDEAAKKYHGEFAYLNFPE